MLVDDLYPSAPNKLNGEAIERSDLALEPDPIYQKHGYLASVIMEMV